MDIPFTIHDIAHDRRTTWNVEYVYHPSSLQSSVLRAQRDGWEICTIEREADFWVIVSRRIKLV